MSAPETRFYAFVSFLVIVLFAGGGSRDDIHSLIVLRPLAVLFCAYALTVKVPGYWKGRSAPLHFICALLTLMVLQLIPLPPSIWSELPNRQMFADIADIAGIRQPWRPLTLSPSKTLNSLFSLAVPIAAMMLYLNLDREHRRRVVPVIIVLCSISALWAIFQLVGPPNGPLYIYQTTNNGFGVGLFANRNHQAVLLASAIVMLGYFASTVKPGPQLSAMKFYGSLVMILICVPLLFITGSRAGVILMAPGLFLALYFVYFGAYHHPRSSRANKTIDATGILFSKRNIVLMVGVSISGGIALLSILLSRSLAFDRLFSGNNVDELRVQLIPVLVEMIRDFLPWGSGFGSFEHVYKIYEPLELLNPTYLNQAHNDWLQFAIEGGGPAILIAFCAIVWFATRAVTMFKYWNTSDPRSLRYLACVAVILFFLAGSIGDYPLRVPSIIALFAVLIQIFNDAILSVQGRDIK